MQKVSLTLFPTAYFFVAPRGGESTLECLSPIHWVRSACVRCHKTKCPLTAFFFSLSLLSASLTFLPEGVIVGFEILHRVLRHQKYKIWDEKNCVFKKNKNKKCLEYPEMARKFIRHIFYFVLPPSQTRAQKTFRWCRWGAERRFKRALHNYFYIY